MKNSLGSKTDLEKKHEKSRPLTEKLDLRVLGLNSKKSRLFFQPSNKSNKLGLGQVLARSLLIINQTPFSGIGRRMWPRKSRPCRPMAGSTASCAFRLLPHWQCCPHRSHRWCKCCWKWKNGGGKFQWILVFKNSIFKALDYQKVWLFSGFKKL